MLRPFLSSLFLSAVLASALGAVEYDGEKSYLLETRYDVCIVPPQVNDAISKGVNVVDLKKAKTLHDQKAHFYDAREKRHFDKSRIRGAKPVYFDVSKAQYIVIELPRDKEEPLVFYCYGESCANSYEAALAVRKLGHKNVYWFLNGFNEWKTQNYPVD